MKFFLFISIYFLSACDVVNPYGEKPTGESSSQPSSSCIAGVPLPLSIKKNKKKKEKILLYKKNFTQQKRKTLKRNQELLVVYNATCLQVQGSFLEGNNNFIFNPRKAYQVKPHSAAAKLYPTKLITKTDYPFEQFKKKVEEDPCIQYVENDLQFHLLAVPNDPFYSQAAHLDYLNAPSAWDVFYHSTTGILSQTVVIAVIDSGGDFDHPDLFANVWTNPGETPSNGTDDDGNGYIDDVHGYNFVSNLGDPSPETPPSGDTDHGTNVAGAAAARMSNGIGATGIMGLNAQIMHLNIAGPNETLSAQGLLEAINYATDKGADVINLSLGINNQQSSAITAAIQNAVDNNVVVVTAAGNDGQEQTETIFSYPGTPLGSQIEGVINVGSLDTQTGQMSSFSNFSDVFVEIMAPGSENSATNTGIFMPDPGSDPLNSYDDASGTSFAAPIVSGAVGLTIALLRARGGNPTPAEIEQTLKDNATSDSQFSGRVQNCNSLDLNVLATGI